MLRHAWLPAPESVWDWGVSWPHEAGSETWSLPQEVEVGGEQGRDEDSTEARLCERRGHL